MVDNSMLLYKIINYNTINTFVSTFFVKKGKKNKVN